MMNVGFPFTTAISLPSAEQGLVLTLGPVGKRWLRFGMAVVGLGCDSARWAGEVGSPVGAGNELSGASDALQRTTPSTVNPNAPSMAITPVRDELKVQRLRVA